ncbi:MAG TPA: hypothetical protein VFP35_02685 [Candidatus Saccharimonadales bacterium]|nr:hypothetical protein [Candidatus Saccharimonadales bacterium]
MPPQTPPIYPSAQAPQVGPQPAPAMPPPSPVPSPAPPGPEPSPTPPGAAPTPAQPGLPGSQPMQLNPAYGHTGLATASLVLGIVSLPASILSLFTLPIPVTAIVLGCISLKRKKGFALAGIILGVIGIILSGVVLAVGLNLEKQKTNRTSLNSSTTANVSSAGISSTCYSFALPAGFTSGDVTKNSDCVTVLQKQDGTNDLAITSTNLTQNVSTADQDAYLKAVIDSLQSQEQGKLTLSNRKYINLDGVRAYEATGAESQGKYTYGGIIAALAPKDYMSVSGLKLRAFLIAFDSSTNQDTLDKVASSWHWQ